LSAAADGPAATAPAAELFDRRRSGPVTSAAVHVLLATDADWIVAEVTAALGGPDTSFTVCREGRLVSDLVEERTPDLGIFDLQIGSMGGMAVTMALRLDESAGTLDHVPVLMLLDRAPDIHLARRSGAEGWLIKPLDPLRLRRAALAIAGGGTYTEGMPAEPSPVEEPPAADDPAAATDSPEGEPATTG
jgi:DNA-binding response OmpR family regulator